MYISKDTILAALPPDIDRWIMIERDQKVRDIIREMLEAYPVFATHYDCIGHFFVGSSLLDTCDNLYDFCKENIEYREETVDLQTSAIPSGIMNRGYGDCKAFASFIGGCLGAIARQTGQPIDWHFCFASYIREQSTPYHVFVIVRGPDGPIWIDPTPGSANMEPKHAECRRPVEVDMALGAVGSFGVDVSGRLTEQIGQVDPGQQAASAVQNFVNSLPDSDIKTGLQKGLQGALPLIAKWLSGYKYTSGDYALGEIFLNRVLNKQTTSRWDTPDSIVPIAWMYFTTLFGIPIAVNTDFDSIRAGTLSAYLAGRPEQQGCVTQEQVTRAHNLLMSMQPDNKYGQWPPTAFGLMPYVGPIPDPRVRCQPFTGTLPNGQLIQNGYPSTAATSGGSVQVPVPATATAAQPPGSGISMTSILIFAAIALGLWWFSEE